jgi:FkbM family methyltransferase
MRILSFTVRTVDRLLTSIGIKAIRSKEFEVLQNMRADSLQLEILKWRGEDVDSSSWMHFDVNSQLGQDFLALASAGFNRGGYFVEFGATDGKLLSNTLTLEKSFGWNGILAEPSPQWRADLAENRSCHIDNRAVWSQSGVELDFFDATSPELSTIGDFAAHDNHSRKLSSAERVMTVSLQDLLDEYQAPSYIDYLSVDTEGSEFEVLNSFDFSKYRFGLITVEHNFTPMREQLHDLLTSNGYKRILNTYSVFDDWYVQVSETVPDRWL